MSYNSENSTTILLKTKETSKNNLSQQKVEENNGETAFVIEPDLDFEEVIEKPSLVINLQPPTPSITTPKYIRKRGLHLLRLSLQQKFKK